MLRHSLSFGQRHALAMCGSHAVRAGQRRLCGVRASLSKPASVVGASRGSKVLPSMTCVSWWSDVGGIDPGMRQNCGLFGTRRTDAFSSAANSEGSRPNPDPGNQPARKTELKKKKTVVAEEAKGAPPAQAEAKKSSTASSTKEGPAPSKAAVIFRKIALDLPKTLARKTYEFFRLLIFEPKEFRAQAKKFWVHMKEELYHYWLGSKLLWQEMKTSTNLIRLKLSGHTLTRRERQQLLKTSADMFRLVPFAVFVIVPFMELLLPITLKLFPNMLPSTFETSSKKEQDFNKQLQVRMDMAVFLQETVQEMAKSMAKGGSPSEKSAKELMQLLEDLRSGKPLPNESIVACAKIFTDEITLDNISRAQLVSMSRYMGLNHFGTDGLLRFQLRNKIRSIKADDQMILWEGIDSLTLDELRKACAERGMRAIGLTEAGYRRQLRQWLDLSINKAVPTSLLILSRAFTITSSASFDAERALQDSISSLDTEVLTEAVLESGGKRTKEDENVMREMRLESLEYQNEMMETEREEALTAQVALPEQPVVVTPKLPGAALSEPVSAGDVAKVPLVAVPAQPSQQAVVTPEARAIAVEAGLLEAKKEFLDKVKATRLKIEGEALLSKGRIKPAGAGPETGEERTKSVTNVKKRLDAMLKAIESDLHEADKSLEGKLKALTETSVSAKLQASQELHDAVESILGSSANADQAAAAIARIAKETGSNAVSAEELKQFADYVHAPQPPPVKDTNDEHTNKSQ